MNSLTVVATSCDKYLDLLEPFSLLFRRYWPDCPYEVVLGTESAIVPNAVPHSVFQRVIPCGKLPWGHLLAKTLDSVSTPYVLFLLDDYLLCDSVSTSTIEHTLALARKYTAGNLRLVPSPRPSRIFSETEKLGEYLPQTAYCVSTQTGIWDTQFLKALSSRFTSGWQFERKASFATELLTQPLLCATTTQFPYVDAIHKGKWERSAFQLCERNGIDVATFPRPVMNDWDYVKKHVKGTILNLNPTRVIQLQNLLKLGKQ